MGIETILIIKSLITGVALLKEYRTHYSEFEAQRGELTNAEKLFDLSITGYPHLLEVEKDLKNSALVFELYEAQRVSPSVHTVMHKVTF
jgi:hypothetical protein